MAATKSTMPTSEFTEFDKVVVKHWSRLLTMTSGAFIVGFLICFLLSQALPDGTIKDFLVNLSAGFYGSVLTFGILTLFDRRRETLDRLVSWRSHQSRLHFLLNSSSKLITSQYEYANRAKRIIAYMLSKNPQSIDRELVEIVVSLLKMSIQDLNRAQTLTHEISFLNAEMYQIIIRFNHQKSFEQWEYINDANKRLTDRLVYLKKISRDYVKFLKAFSERDGSKETEEQLKQMLEELIELFNEYKHQQESEDALT